MFFEALNLRPYTVNITSTIQRYEVRKKKPLITSHIQSHYVSGLVIRSYIVLVQIGHIVNQDVVQDVVCTGKVGNKTCIVKSHVNL
jgi:hypothetical protein